MIAWALAKYPLVITCASENSILPANARHVYIGALAAERRLSSRRTGRRSFCAFDCTGGKRIAQGLTSTGLTEEQRGNVQLFNPAKQPEHIGFFVARLRKTASLDASNEH